MSLQRKLVVMSFCAMVALSCLLFGLYFHDVRGDFREANIEKARMVVLAAEATREEMANAWAVGVFDADMLSRWAAEGNLDKVLVTVPVMAAMNAVRAGAEEGHYEFRTPKFSPRNPENEPDEVEARVLRMFKQTGAAEHYEIDESLNVVRFFRPVRLTEECLLCHGDPAMSATLWGNDQGLDATGARMEGWRVGEVHGAFEVIQSLNGADAHVAAIWKNAGIMFLVVVGACLVYWVVLRRMLCRIPVLVGAIERVSVGYLREVETMGTDEIGGIAVAFNETTAKLQEVVRQANRISQGDFTAKIEPRSDEDELGTALSRMSETLRDVVVVCEGLAAGDYTREIVIKGDKDVLGRAINTMIENVRGVMAEIRTAGAKMVAASREQADGARNQSVSTEEMSSTVSELLASARSMTESGASVSAQAAAASDECSQGTTSVESAVHGIRGIHERVERIAGHMLELGSKSQQINSVLDVITELSEQTNLLSLNASIEAAGAGEAGKRFAVVASEIRKLAERATGSTVEIRTLIENIQETVNTTIMATEQGTKVVQDGVRLTEEVDSSFRRIAEQVNTTAQVAKAIEMSSRQQVTAIEQMEVAVQSVDRAAQQSAASARQLNADAERMLETTKQQGHDKKEPQMV